MIDRRKTVVNNITIEPLGKCIGAEVKGVDFSRPLPPEDVALIQSAWSRHLVLRFRGQDPMSAEELIAFSRNFGELDARPIAARAVRQGPGVDHPEITTISNIKVDGVAIGGLGDGEAVWHADMTYVTSPPKGAALHALEIPAEGGCTYFANMYAAYEALPQEVRDEIEDRTCIHDASRTSAGDLRIGFKEVSDPRRVVGAVHPLVRLIPETQRRCLLLGRRPNAYIPGLSLEKSEDLLDRLWAAAIDPAWTWKQEWQLGDVVMWDNRCSMHRRDAFPATSRRLMIRTQIRGGVVHGA